MAAISPSLTKLPLSPSPWDVNQQAAGAPDHVCWDVMLVNEIFHTGELILLSYFHLFWL